jgi:hypothetical protein
VPALSILQPENEATPAAAFLGFDVQVRTAPPAGAVMLRVTDAVLEVTVLPLAS